MVASWHWKDIVETIKKHYPEYTVPTKSGRDSGLGGEVIESLLDNAPNYLPSWVRYPKESLLRMIIYSSYHSC